MLEVKWRDVTEEEEAGHLEVTSEILLHISPMRPIFQVTLTDSEQILWSLAGRACTWDLLKAIDEVRRCDQVTSNTHEILSFLVRPF